MLLKNRYEVQDKIGSGGFGSVHRALDRETIELVAIKFLSRPSDIELFQKEMRQLYQQINNRFVVKLLDHDLSAPKPYIVLEYCAGGSLQSWVGKNNPWQQVANALSCATGGLVEIHRNNGFHRDIKPDNLLLSKDPETKLPVVKLGDLGLARIPSAGSMTYSPAGTKNYMAPEVLEAFLQPNHVSYQYAPSADVYSLGITALELLTGKTEIKELDHLDKEKIPSDFIKLVKKMCDPKAEGRPSTELIAEELSNLLAPPPLPSTAIEVPMNVVLPQPVVHPQPIVPFVPVQQANNNRNALVGVGLGALALLALAKLLDNNKDWDPAVERYRGPDGRFRS